MVAALNDTDSLGKSLIKPADRDAPAQRDTWMEPSSAQKFQGSRHSVRDTYFAKLGLPSNGLTSVGVRTQEHNLAGDSTFFLSKITVSHQRIRLVPESFQCDRISCVESQNANLAPLELQQQRCTSSCCGVHVAAPDAKRHQLPSWSSFLSLQQFTTPGSLQLPLFIQHHCQW